jgi:hypothetical protein
MNGCPKCGFENDRSDVFCGSCGAFLEWSRTETGAKVAVSAGAPATPPAAGTGDGGIAGTESDMPVVEDSGPVVEDSDPVVEDAEPMVLTTEERMRRRAEALRAKAPPGSMRVTKHRHREGRAGVEAGREPVAGAPEAVPPGAVKPAVPQARPKPTPAPPTRELQTGDLICGECGEGNVPTRKFCRRCGTSLVDAEAVAAPPVPWWKRPFVRKPKKEFTAGERPMRRGGTEPGTKAKGGRAKKVLAAAGAVAAVGLVLAVAGPWRSSVNHKVGDVKRTVAPNFDPVHPVAVTASSELKDHPAAMATDGISNTFWAEGAKGKGENQALVLTFDPAIDINKVGILSGASGKPEEFLAQPRPKTLHLIFSDGTTKDLSLKDSGKFQSFDVDARLITKLEVQISSVYSSVQGGQDAAISELEFYTKR